MKQLPMKSILSTLFIIIFLTSSTIGCECSGKPTVTDNWEYADDVFIGKVINVDTSYFIKTAYGRKYILFTIEIIEPLKYNIYQNNELRSFISAGGGTCEGYFNIGETYLIYASRKDIFLYSSICSRTDIISTIADNEINQLRQLYNKPKTTEQLESIEILKQNNYNEYELNIAYSINKNQRHKIIILSIVSLALTVVVILTFIFNRRKKTNA